MSRNKQRKTDTIETLREENKELRTLVKSLQRELKALNKDANIKPEFNRDDLIKEEMESKVKKCSNCGKGKIITTDLGIRKLVHCSICTYRETLKT